MEPAKDKPPTEQPKDQKTTPAQQIPAFSAREAARIWGISSARPPGIRRRFPYSIT